MFKGWELLYMFTLPDDDWLVGIEYAPDNSSINLDTGEETLCSIISIGFLLIRIDILIPFKNEE